mgnify:CR=1 FL=1
MAFERVDAGVFAEVEKMLKFKFWDKGRERSNRAAGLADRARGTTRICPMRHDQLAYSGPPDDSVQTYVCLRCNAAACEPEIKDRGYEFGSCPDWIIYEILDLDLKRQAEGNAKLFGMYSGHVG